MARQKLPVSFPSHGGQCVGDLYLPKGGPAPVILMAHGIGAERSFRLDAFAEYFVERGLAVLVFDYRNFGDSPGEPRCLVDPKRHVEDYLAAIDFVQMEKRVAGDRLGLWGTSFSGGHVLVVAAKRPEAVHAVVSQVPFVSGVASTLLYPPKFLLPGLRRAAADGLRALVGGSPVTIPVVAQERLALLAPPDCSEGYGALVPKDSQWPNQVPARILLTLPLYNPAASASKIKAPTLMIGARDDSLIPIKNVRKTAAKLQNGRFVELPIGHFSPYSGEWFDKVVRLECEFLCEKLSNRFG